MADISKSVGKKGREYADGVNTLHNDSTLTDTEKTGAQQLFRDGLNLLGGQDRFLDRNVTSTLTLSRGTSPSFTFSIVTT